MLCDAALLLPAMAVWNEISVIYDYLR